MKPSEALELMEQDIVGGMYEGTDKYGTVEVVNAEMRGVEPFVKVLPHDHNSQPVVLNKHWMHLADFKQEFFA